MIPAIAAQQEARSTRLGGRQRPAGRRSWGSATAMAVGAVIHLGTAAVRLGDVVHPARMIDFASLYTAAWALRHGVSPYQEWSPALLATLRETRHMDVVPGPMLATPLWPWLFQPITVLPFPVAAWLWLVTVLGVVWWSAVRLARMAGCTGRYEMAAAVTLVATFGPVVLSLTLGQSSPLLLVAALLIGRGLDRGRLGGGALGWWGLAVAAKLFPVLWAGGWLLMRQARAIVGATAVALVLLVTVVALKPSADLTYVRYIGSLTLRLTESAGLDDQSLLAWVQRLGRSHTVMVHGLAATDQRTVQWDVPWAVEPAYLTVLASVILVALGAVVVAVLWRNGRRNPGAAFHLWVLYALLPLPHTMRYNHVLLLPALAWLWGRGPAGRGWASAGYLLAALSRLTHLWAMLPAPWGPLGSGCGTVAVLVLGAGVGRQLVGPAPTPTDQSATLPR